MIRREALKHIFIYFCFVSTIFSLSCIKKEINSLPPLSVSLYSGIRDLVQLNDSETHVKAQLDRLGISYNIVPASEQKNLQEMKLDKIYIASHVGLKVYFKKAYVVMIELQEPFNGSLSGQNASLFPFQSKLQGGTTDTGWGATLTRHFGPPRVELTGGRLFARGLFYDWGDISYNGLGPNQIAIYKDSELMRYREKNFSRPFSFF